MTSEYQVGTVSLLKVGPEVGYLTYCDWPSATPISASLSCSGHFLHSLNHRRLLDVLLFPYGFDITPVGYRLIQHVQVGKICYAQ
jgi:hypothetical protein